MNEDIQGEYQLSFLICLSVFMIGVIAWLNNYQIHTLILTQAGSFALTYNLIGFFNLKNNLS